MKIAVVGAGSREFGPAIVADILLSDAICQSGLVLSLMDLQSEGLSATASFARTCAETLGRQLSIDATTKLDAAVDGADYVILAIERNRYFYWSQDFHVPRKLGFSQIYGENGGPGGMFHALRNIGPCLAVARAMEKGSPDGWLLNFTNPLTKLCQALGATSGIKVVGLCHGIFSGMRQVGALLDRPIDEMVFQAAGLNHCTWFTSIRDRKTGSDLYPELREREGTAHWLSGWDDMALSRLLFRSFGRYPSPGTNHIGEYLGWAQGMLASSALQFFYDPAEGDPWTRDRIPPWIYSLREDPTRVPPTHPVSPGRLRSSERSVADPTAPKPSGELAVPLIEGVGCGLPRRLDAVDLPNRGFVSGLPDDVVVEVPARAERGTITPEPLDPLPPGVTALLRHQASINDLLVEAFRSGSRRLLLQALLLDPNTPSYHNAVHLIDEMFELQGDVLPAMEW